MSVNTFTKDAAVDATQPSVEPAACSGARLRGRRAAVLLFSYYPDDNRPRRSAEALVNEGMRVELICLRKSTEERARETFNGVDIRRLPLRRHRGGPIAYLLQYAAFLVSAFFLLAVRSLPRRFDLVHVHNMPDFLVFSAAVPKLLGAKVILDLHDPMPELMMTIFRLEASSFGVRLLKHFERWSIALADAVFTVNLACKKIFESRSCRADKVHVVMNSPDENIFGFRSVLPVARQADHPFVMMYHGSILERNGLDLAVDALATIRPGLPSAELRIYGEETTFLELVLKKVREAGLNTAVRYFGAKGPEGIAAAIDECDVGIIPNRRSVFTEINTPTRIFEYLSRGKPVIAGRAPGVQDYFADDALFFFKLGNAADLARIMTYVFYHSAEVEGVVRRGQKVYLAHRWSEERSGLVNKAAELLSPATPPQ